MNNKGFTLVELLAVIIILSGMSLVVVGSISSSLIKRDQKECEEQIELAKNAAKIYFSLNEDINSVTVLELKNNDYFNANKKVDRLNDDSTVTYDNNGYTFNGTCKES